MKWIVLVTVLAAGCGSKAPPPPPPSAEGGGPRAIVPGMPDAPWTLAYADGSANSYKIWSDADGAAFEYDPITPAESSTGMYSGGDPRAGRVDATTLASIWQQVRDLEANTAEHSPDRNKGTGSFSITEPSGQRAFIVNRTPALLAFDELLAGLK
jgi:hypothetical protein